MMAWTKFKAQPVDFDGHTKKQCETLGITYQKCFDSKRERIRYLELVERLERGEIQFLLIHPTKLYPFRVNGVLISSYTPDFTYFEDGVYIVEDVKSEISAKLSDYIMRKKLMLALYDIKIREVF